MLEEAPPTEPHLQLSQIISAREVRGGEMSKYLNKFHRSLLRAGRCGEGAGGGGGGEGSGGGGALLAQMGWRGDERVGE